MDEVNFVRQLYARFNAREMDALLALMADDVEWANAFEGGHEHGPEAVRAYWTRQWAEFDPRVEPVSVKQGDGGEWVAEVHQVVKDLAGKVLFDGTVEHVFRLEGGVVKRFDVR